MPMNPNFLCCIGAELKNSTQQTTRMTQVYLYRAFENDTLSDMLSAGFFNEAVGILRQDDLLLLYSPNETVAKWTYARVSNVDRDGVTVAQIGIDATAVAVDTAGYSNLSGDNLQQIMNNLDTLLTTMNNAFVKKDGTSIMSAPLKFVAGSLRGGIGPTFGGVEFYTLNNDSPTYSLVPLGRFSTNGFLPHNDNTYDIGSTARHWKDAYIARVITAVINNGYDIAVPVTNSADTLALKSQVDDAANSGEQLYTTGVWYAKMYAATVVPTGAEYNGKNYADFSQVDNDNNPIVVIYEGQSGSWVEIARITPPANHVAYLTITSKIWDIAEQTNQQGGEILWSYNQKTFTPYPKIVSVAGLANTDLSNLTATGANITNWSSNVTNCINEIPQDIKLELSAGTLTLKAGSKVYVPNGAGVFDAVTIANDLTTTSTSNEQNLVFLYNGGLGSIPVKQCFSGSSAPSAYQYMFWYDTTNNLVKFTSDSGSTWTANSNSLPLGLVTASSLEIISIDRIFNDFGFIGSTLFALPVAKGLMPNGRNADGTLKNTVFTVNNVITKTTSYDFDSQCVLIMRDTGIDYVKHDFYLESETTPTLKQYARLYQSTENQMYYGGASAWEKINAFNFGLMTLDSNGKITSFSTKTPFRAVDYNEADFVVAYQKPTAENNYTWFRKYKSGWVEQGGEITATSVADGSGTAGNNEITLPIKMANTHYWYSANTGVGGSGWDYTNGIVLASRTTQKITFKVVAGTSSNLPVLWQVKGFAA